MIQLEHAAPARDAGDECQNNRCGSDAPRLAGAEFGLTMWTSHHGIGGRPVEARNPELVPAGVTYALVKASGRGDGPVERAHRICRQRRIIERALRGNDKQPGAFMALDRHAEIASHRVVNSDKGTAMRAAKLHPDASSPDGTAGMMPSRH